ncbi:hypothetical protein CNBG_2007 [Cryptococcus deuterogattii R265]|uniref:uncharacterized protein n=1 Tax=Cryptococcus deuterogattii (strain R265) TaxID=294750 RepID=UPI001934FC70|nr:hypothetical protein CNBG_2007 [Cryptococcus deuterogattii R265]
MSSSQSSTHFTQSSASTAAGPTTTSKCISHPSGKQHVLLTSFAAEGALPILQRVSRNSQLDEEWAVEVPNTYMLPWIAPADEPNHQTAESLKSALELIQKWTEASHPSKNYAASFELDKTLDWPEPTASFSEFEKFTKDYVSNVQQVLCRRVADEVAKSMENNDFFTYSVVDEPEFTFRGGLIPHGRIKPMDLEEYQSQISISAEDQQAWKAAHSMPVGSSIVFITSGIQGPSSVYVKPNGEWDTCDPAYKIDCYPISNPYELSEEMAKSIDFATEEIKKQYFSSNWNKDLPSVANSGISLDSGVEDYKDLNKRFTKALQSRSRETASDIDKTIKSFGVTGVSIKWVSPATCQSMFLQELPPRMTSRGELRDYEQWLQQRLLLARQASVSHQTEVTSAAPESKMPNTGSLNVGDKGR